MRIKRLQDIVDYINKTGVVSFSDLCKEFDTSSATMRRDLKELDGNGLIQKIHGGAKSIIVNQQMEPPYVKRLNLNVEEKKRIAKVALQSIHEKDIIILDSSTTTVELAKLLIESTINIVVITNDAYIAYLLAFNPAVDLILVGGTIRNGFYTAVGLFSEMMWKQLHANRLFLGVDAINPNLGALSFQIEEVRSKRLMVECSEECIALCDHTKFSASAVLEICPITSIHKVITGTEVDDAHVKSYAKYENLQIIRA